MKPRDVDDCTRRCRCQDPEGRAWAYLNAFCRHRVSHKPLTEYGYPLLPWIVSAREYHRQHMAAIRAGRSA